MKKVIASKDFSIGDRFYIKDEEIKDVDFKTIVKLNEQGFIYPLTNKDLILIKEEEEDGTTL